MELGFRIWFEDKTVYIPKETLTGNCCGDITTYRTKVADADVVWTHTAHAGGTLVEVEVTSQKPLGIRRIDSIVCTTGVPAATDHITTMGRIVLQNEIRFPHEFGVDTEYCPNAVGHYAALDGKGLILSGISPFENICAAVAVKDREGRFTFSFKTEYTQSMLKYTRLKTERAYINESVTMEDFFGIYRGLLPQSSFPMPKITGWNSWDYYLSRVTAEDVFENAAALKEMPFAKELRYIVIDDGWQKSRGEWTENEKFACGLKAVADGILEADFIPGIWMAPVGVQKDGVIASQHPQWLCRDETGEYLTKYGMYYLDPTHPEAHRFIMDNYRYQYAAGFRLFKMDFVSPLLECKDFYDKNATPYGVLAQLVRDVQESTGPDTVVLGCSLPVECGADIAPSMRIGMDVHNHFSHVRAISRSIAWASIFNNKITRIDPDFLIVRGEETSTEPLIWEEGGVRKEFYAPPRAKQTDKDRRKVIWRHGDQFTAIEAETWANLVALSGGNLFLSDRMSALNERGIEIIDKAFRLAGESVKPVYLPDDHRTPSLWLGDKAMVLVNWEEVPRTVTVTGIRQKLKACKPFTQEGDRVTVTLLPHESFAALYET